MRIYLINLAQSTDRLAAQQAQFARLGISFIHSPATSVADFSDDEYHARAFGWQRPLKKVEMACFLSHYKLWQTCVDLGEPIIILEDDVLLSDDFPDLLNDLAKLNGVDYVNLEVCAPRHKILGSQPIASYHDKYSVLPLHLDKHGMGGYVLYPTGAIKLIEKLNNEPMALADAFIFSHDNLIKAQLEPAIVLQSLYCTTYGINGTHHESMLATSPKVSLQNLPLGQIVQFRLRRLMGEISAGLRYLANYFKGEKRAVRINAQDFRGDIDLS